MIDNWRLIETAPKDGTELLLWEDLGLTIGSWCVDFNYPDEEPQWFGNSYNDFSTGYASCPIHPTHWMPIEGPIVGKG